MKTVKTDILVIGGGLAGLTAAIEAKHKNNTVTMVCKSLAGRSGNTIVAGSAMASAQTNNNDSAELLYNDVIGSSQGINDNKMAEYFALHSAEVVEKLSGYGVIFNKVGGKHVTKRPPGHSVPRSFTVDISKVPYNNRGLSMSLPLLEQVIKRGVRIINNTMVYKLLKEDGSIAGALAINKKENKIICLRADVVIVAAGGGGNIFAMTNNTADITGDSYCLALEAGAELRDMEYVQYYPTMMFEPLKVTISNPLFGEGAVLRNINDYEFMEQYSEEGSMATRDTMAQAIYSEILAGRGNPHYVFVDCGRVSEEVIDNKFGEFKNLLARRKINVKKDYMPVSPAAHFYLGGIKVDANCETGVPGLLACGEAVWGVHGANRLSGNALTEAVVFGTLAGQRAVEVSEGLKSDAKGSKVSDVPEEHTQQWGKRNVFEVRSELRKMMWKNAAVMRDEERLTMAQEMLKALNEEIEDCKIDGLKDRVKYFETKNLLRLSDMIIAGSLLRRESRGAHYRRDYPATKEKYKGNFVYTLKKDKVNIEFMHK